MKKVGIDSISYYVPSLYVDIEDLASKRNIPAEKLTYGLGLKKMSIPDFDEDHESSTGRGSSRTSSDSRIWLSSLNAA